jgi:hypothetical protein
MTENRTNRTQNANPSEPKKKAKRSKGRTKTGAEREGLALRKLQDKFGDSPIAPGEPELVGVPARAIECARHRIKWTLRANKDFKPNAAAKEVAQICRLAPEKEKLLRDWLVWLKSRKWVLTTANRSPVIAWLNTNPHLNEEWSHELHDQWCDQINASYRKATGAGGVAAHNTQQAATKQASCSSGSVAPVSDNNAAISRSPDRSGEPSGIHGGEVKADSSSRSGDHFGTERPAQSFKQPTAGSSAEAELPLGEMPRDDAGRPTKLNIPKVERFHYRSNPHIVKFFNAMKTGSEPQIRAAAQTLADDPQIFEEICGVSQDHRRYVAEVFAELGMNIPGSGQ